MNAQRAILAWFYKEDRAAAYIYKAQTAINCVAKDCLRQLRSDAGQTHQGSTPAPLETNIPGLFAMGDVRSGSVKRMGGAIGEGAAAVAMIHRHLAVAESALAVAR